jgi:hypothetical protein
MELKRWCILKTITNGAAYSRATIVCPQIIIDWVEILHNCGDVCGINSY